MPRHYLLLIISLSITRAATRLFCFIYATPPFIIDYAADFSFIFSLFSPDAPLLLRHAAAATLILRCYAADDATLPFAMFAAAALLRQRAFSLLLMTHTRYAQC